MGHQRMDYSDDMTPKSAAGNSGHLLLCEPPNSTCSNVSAATVIVRLFDFARIFFSKSCFAKLDFDLIGISESRIKKDHSPINNINLEGYFYKSCPTESSVGGHL